MTVHDVWTENWCHRSLAVGYLEDLRAVIDAVPSRKAGALIAAVVEAAQRGSAVRVAGNGGSSATATHLVNDCAMASAVGGCPTSFSCLSDNMARVTAIANDLSYDEVFAEQIRTSGRPDDQLLLISVSGTSTNLVHAANAARAKGMGVLSLLGAPGAVAERSDVAVVLGTTDYGLAEDVHLAFNHMLVRALRGSSHEAREPVV